ncbi:hypothetical protein [uncultured Muribaculum sp.]|uniref:hypothetical protein n=1 Tax=uncultured Muribaculum sp. TaxID=1918613 RepID=UPI002592936C|nr:hypothetical protein [uncultured Muribaculum sp.]
MRKFSLFSFLMLFIVLNFVFSSCSKDDDNDDIQLTKEMVVGTWDVTNTFEDGKSIYVPSGMIRIVLRKNDSYVVQFYANRYIGTYTVKGNSVVGTTLDPIKEYFKFENLNGNNAIINYSNNQGDKYVFLAIKTN